MANRSAAIMCCTIKIWWNCTPEPKRPSRSQHLARIHDPARIESRFDRSHRVDGGTDFAPQSSTLAESDTVLAGASAVESEGVSNDLVAETLDFGEFLGGVWINREHDVEVSVADMAKEWGWEARRFERFLRSANALGET